MRLSGDIRRLSMPRFSGFLVDKIVAGADRLPLLGEMAWLAFFINNLRRLLFACVNMMERAPHILMPRR